MMVCLRILINHFLKYSILILGLINSGDSRDDSLRFILWMNKEDC